MPAKLERIDIDDVGRDVGSVVGEIHRQLGNIDPPVPVSDIALALDIEEIRAIDCENFEAMPLTGPTRDTGAICVNKGSARQRQRTTLAASVVGCQKWHSGQRGALPSLSGAR